jgi:4-hydroxy-tetrahydrodipicolinate synthase
MFKGSLVALATPFLENGEIDHEAFEELVEWQIEEGTDGILIAGTTGEAPTLSFEEQKYLLQKTIEIAKGRVFVIAGTGSNDTRKSVLLTEQAQKVGADAALCIFPYYNRPSFGGCLAHFHEVAKVRLPMMLYYHPVRTALRLPVEQLAEICAIDEVVAIKESPGDTELVVDLMQRCPKPLFTGDDSVAFPLLAAGASGTCSVIANIFPSAWKKMTQCALEGNFHEARTIYNHFFPVCKALFIEPNPIGVKYALSLLGRANPYLRLPLVEPEESTKKKIQKALDAVQFKSPLSGVRL